MSTRKQYPKAFKLEAVRQLTAGEKPVASLARDLCILRKDLYRWKQEYADKGELAESFFATLGFELIEQQTFASRNAARLAIFDFIEVFYNRQRAHQTLDYLTPEKYESLKCAA